MPPPNRPSPDWVRLARTLLGGREARLAVFLVLAGLIVGAMRPAFLQPSNLRDIFTEASPLIIGAAGMTIIIVGGGIDISIGSMFGACALAAGTAAQRGASPLMCLLVALGLGALLGAWNGWLIAGLRIPAIVATLGMLSIVRGTTIYLTGGNEVRDLPEAFRDLGVGDWLGLPRPLWYAAAAVAFTAFLLQITHPGRQIYAMGGNDAAAALAAIRVRTLRWMTYVLGGFFVGFAALAQAARFSSIQTTTGTGFELVVITSVVLGGTSILGGRGTVWGSALGALVLEAIPSALTFLGVETYWKPAAQGAVVLLAVLSSASTRKGDE